MVDVAEDDGGDSLCLLRNCIPPIQIPPFNIVPNYTCNSIINDINFLLFPHNLGSEPEYKSDENDSDIDDDWKYTDDGYFLEYSNLFFQNEY